MTQPRRHRFIWWTLTLGWMALIYFLSSRPDLHSGLQPTWDFVLRKIAHAVEFGILAILIIRAVGREIPNRRDLLIGVLFASLYAATDEYHQTYIPGRNGSVIDWAIDVIGVILGAFFLHRHLSGRAIPSTPPRTSPGTPA